MIYLDTSIALLILLEQEGGGAAEEILRRAESHEKVASSALLRVEMARALHREGLEWRIAQELLKGVDMISINDDVIERACTLTGELKSLDAIHLATALLLNDPRDPITVLTHDAQLAAAARAHSLSVVDLLD